MPECIEREKVIELIENYGKDAVNDGVTELDPVKDIKILADAVKLIPTVDVGVRLGHWVEKPSRFGSNYKLYGCSVCDWTFTFRPDYSYCPRCGAYMKGCVDNG